MKTLNIILGILFTLSVSYISTAQTNKKDNGVEYNETRITNEFQINTSVNVDEEANDAVNELEKEGAIVIIEEKEDDFDKMVETRRSLRYRKVRNRAKKCYKEVEDKMEEGCDSITPKN